jgi:hypothetical protein
MRTYKAKLDQIGVERVRQAILLVARRHPGPEHAHAVVLGGNMVEAGLHLSSSGLGGVVGAANRRASRGMAAEEEGGKMTDKQLRAIFDKTNGHCHFCGDPLKFDNRGLIDPPDGHWEVDHVVHRGSGGSKSVENCLPACSRCNRWRWNRTGEAMRNLLLLGVIAVEEIDRGTPTGRRLRELKGKRLAKNKGRRKPPTQPLTTHQPGVGGIA